MTCHPNQIPTSSKPNPRSKRPKLFLPTNWCNLDRTLKTTKMSNSWRYRMMARQVLSAIISRRIFKVNQENLLRSNLRNSSKWECHSHQSSLLTRLFMSNKKYFNIKFLNLSQMKKERKLLKRSSRRHSKIKSGGRWPRLISNRLLISRLKHFKTTR